MHHPTEGDLQGMLDGELEPGQAGRVRDHLADCAACRAVLAEQQQAAESFSDSLLLLDAGARPPSRWPTRELAPAGGRRQGSERHGLRWRWGTLARAAALILAAAGAASALAPGSPVRDWLGDLVRTEAAVKEGPAIAPEVAAPAAPAPAGVSVAPAEGRVRVVLEGFAPESRVRLRVVDRREARVRVEGAHAMARFVVGSGELRVIGGNDGTVWVELPRTAGEATVEIDGEVAVRVAEGQLQLHRPVADSLQEDVLILFGEE